MAWNTENQRVMNWMACDTPATATVTCDTQFTSLSDGFTSPLNTLNQTAGLDCSFFDIDQPRLQTSLSSIRSSSSPMDAMDPRTDDLASVVEDIDADEPYNKLLWRCLRTAPDHERSLRDIYDWFRQNTNKGHTPDAKGWQNSIRHNLSMNDAFQRGSRTAVDDNRKNVWSLRDHAISQDIQPTTRFRKPQPATPQRKSARGRVSAQGSQLVIRRRESGRKGGHASQRSQAQRGDAFAANSRDSEFGAGSTSALANPSASPTSSLSSSQSRISAGTACSRVSYPGPEIFATNSSSPHLLNNAAQPSNTNYGYMSQEYLQTFSMMNGGAAIHPAPGYSDSFTAHSDSCSGYFNAEYESTMFSQGQSSHADLHSNLMTRSEPLLQYHPSQATAYKVNESGWEGQSGAPAAQYHFQPLSGSAAGSEAIMQTHPAERHYAVNTIAPAALAVPHCMFPVASPPRAVESNVKSEDSVFLKRESADMTFAEPLTPSVFQRNDW